MVPILRSLIQLLTICPTNIPHLTVLHPKSQIDSLILHRDLLILRSTDAGDGDQGIARARCPGGTRKLVGVILQIFEKAFKLALHRIHLFAHIEDDLDTRQIYPEVARQ